MMGHVYKAERRDDKCLLVLIFARSVEVFWLDHCGAVGVAYEGTKSPFGIPHFLSGKTEQRSYREIQSYKNGTKN